MMFAIHPSRRDPPGLQNLRRLHALRNFAIAGQTLAVLTAVFGFGIPLPLLPMGVLIAGLTAANLITGRRIAGGREVTERELLGQLLLDAGTLAGLLYCSGGAYNPFVWLLLLPVAIAATLLRPAYTRLLAATTVACYSVLMVTHRPLPRDDLLLGHGFQLHVIGMWVGFVISAALMSYFVARMATTLREREHSLAQQREQALRDERLVALGALAAGVAHELGTPLSTMATLAHELQQEHARSGNVKDLQRQMLIFREQIDRCKQALKVMSASAGDLPVEEGRGVAADDYLREVNAEWRALRPRVQSTFSLQGDGPAPRLVADRTLSQALITILHNAADASPDEVSVNARWDSSSLTIDICDRGRGLTSGACASAGKQPFTTKADGLGLGLFLAHAVIGRLGGEVALLPRNGGGTCARVCLALAALRAVTGP